LEDQAGDGKPEVGGKTGFRKRRNILKQDLQDLRILKISNPGNPGIQRDRKSVV